MSKGTELSTRIDLCIIIPFLEKYGGAERFAVECIRYWQERHKITIYATRFSRYMLDEHNINKDINLVELPPYFEGEHSMLLNALLLPKIWREQIGRHDIYHCHLWPTHLIDLHPMVWFPHEPLRVLHDLRYEQNVEHIGSNVSRNIHIYPKYSYDAIGDSLYEAYLSAIDSMDKSAKPDRVVANSFYTAGYLEDVYGIPVKDVVYPGVEPEKFISLPKDKNFFVTISQLWPHKRVNLLIEAIALVDDAQLAIIGSGPEKQHLQEIATKLGVEDRVFFLSGLSNLELRIVLARACAFLFSPIKEPFGIVVLEALAAGLPVIAVNEGGYAEICKPEFAFLVKPYPHEFAEKMRYLRENPDVAQQMSNAGKNVAPDFKWKRTADELEAIIIDVWEQSKANKVAKNSTAARSLIGIQYYLWFSEGFGASHWNDDPSHGHVADRPILGYYGSTKGQIINSHLDLFEQMDLDFVILNLHIDNIGANGTELMGIQHVFDIATKRNSSLKFAIQLAPYVDDFKECEKILRMISKIFADHNNYLKMNDQPVLFWFWSSAYDTNKRLIGELKKAAEQYTNIAVSLRLPHETEEDKLTFGFFDGFVPFSPLELSEEKNWEKVWKSAYRNAQKAGMRYRIASLSPGYDDSGLTAETRIGNPYRVIPRKDGATFEAGIRFVEKLEETPDLIMISTFNEFHENTHIEPSLKNGMKYVELTTNFVKRIKKKWGES